MKIEQLPGNPGNRQSRKRVGRGEGSGHGRTSGRGNKGAQSRSGYKRRAGYEGGQMPMYRRVPKRGFNNPFRVEYQIVNVAGLECFSAGAEVNRESLYDRGLIDRRRQPVKILGNGELSKNLNVTVEAFSKSARAKIEAAGGSCSLAAATPQSEGAPAAQ